MKSNVSNQDRVIRLVIALAAVIGAGLIGFGSLIGIVLLVVAVVMVVTAAVGFCPLYRIFGVSTRPVPSAQAKDKAAASR